MSSIRQLKTNYLLMKLFNRIVAVLILPLILTLEGLIIILIRIIH